MGRSFFKMNIKSHPPNIIYFLVYKASYSLPKSVHIVQVRECFNEMAKLVDQQNAREPNYIPMSVNPDQSPAFQAALKLVLEGKKAPNGYTEYTLHEFRKKIKGDVGMRSKLWYRTRSFLKIWEKWSSISKNWCSRYSPDRNCRHGPPSMTSFCMRVR